MKRIETIASTLRLGLLTAVISSLASGCSGQELAQVDGEETHREDVTTELEPNALDLPILEDGEEAFGDNVTLISDVRLHGTRLMFLQLTGDGGEQIGAGLLEQMSADGVGLAAEPRLEHASMLDIFLAVTGPDVDIPAELLEYKNQDIGERGWLATQAAGGQYSAQGICDNNTFKSWLRNWIPPTSFAINGTELWRTDESPSPNDAEWDGPFKPLVGINCPECSSSWYYWDHFSTQWAISNVDAMKQGVNVCNIASRPRLGATFGTHRNHLGPLIRFQYRTENNVSIVTAFSKDMAANEENTRWHWYWEGSPAAGQNDFDWRIKISHAREGDVYDLGWIREHHGW